MGGDGACEPPVLLTPRHGSSFAFPLVVHPLRSSSFRRGRSAIGPCPVSFQHNAMAAEVRARTPASSVVSAAAILVFTALLHAEARELAATESASDAASQASPDQTDSGDSDDNSESGSFRAEGSDALLPLPCRALRHFVAMRACTRLTKREQRSTWSTRLLPSATLLQSRLCTGAPL